MRNHSEFALPGFSPIEGSFSNAIVALQALLAGQTLAQHQLQLRCAFLSCTDRHRQLLELLLKRRVASSRLLPFGCYCWVLLDCKQQFSLGPPQLPMGLKFIIIWLVSHFSSFYLPLNTFRFGLVCCIVWVLFVFDIIDGQTWPSNVYSVGKTLRAACRRLLWGLGLCLGFVNDWNFSEMSSHLRGPFGHTHRYISG